MRERGEVKFYNSERKYGYIERKGKSENVHFGRDSFKGNTPFKGDEVEFDVVKQQRRPHAVNLRITTGSSHDSEHIQYIRPKDTREIVRPDDIDNFALRLNKTPFFDYDEKFKFFKVDKNRGLNVQPDYSKIDIKAIAERHKRNIEKLNIESESIILKPEWRMLIGLGNESVYETSMTLHHIYGIPYIPGQAVKGVLRNYIINEVFGEIKENGEIKLDLEGAEKRALTDEDFCKIFGTPKDSAIGEHIGSVIFFDAFPIETPTIKPDIMNVHYPEYYSGKKPPTDYQKLNPIYFLTVGEDEKGNKARFRFLIGVKKKDDFEIKNTKLTEKIKCNDVLSVIEHCLIKSLSEHGIGAKTAVGYGYMDSVQYDN